MSKKITVTLSDKATAYFYTVYGSLEVWGEKPCNMSECINECLEALSDFEKGADNQLRNWNEDFAKVKGKNLRELISNPTKENINKFKK